MVGTLSTVFDSEKILLILWKHECCRVFSDRFTIQADKDWFNATLTRIIETRLGVESKGVGDSDPVFVDFMR